MQNIVTSPRYSAGESNGRQLLLAGATWAIYLEIPPSVLLSEALFLNLTSHCFLATLLFLLLSAFFFFLESPLFFPLLCKLSLPLIGLLKGSYVAVSTDPHTSVCLIIPAMERVKRLALFALFAFLVFRHLMIIFHKPSLHLLLYIFVKTTLRGQVSP